MNPDTHTLPVSWPDLQRVFYPDGSLRDLIIRSDDLRDWQAAYEYAQGLVARGRATMETQPPTLPSNVDEIFELRQIDVVGMLLFVGPVQINCHFFGGPIEFDVEPREVSTPEAASSVVEFVEGLADAVDKRVSVTEESVPADVWLTYDPATRGWEKGPMFDTNVGGSPNEPGLLRRLLARVRGG
jgi:hypothetical protein